MISDGSDQHFESFRRFAYDFLKECNLLRVHATGDAVLIYAAAAVGLTCFAAVAPGVSSIYGAAAS